MQRIAILLAAVGLALPLASSPAQSLQSATLDQTSRSVTSICEQRGVEPGGVVRVRTHLAGSVMTPRTTSVVGPVLRCREGELVLGPYLGQDAPQYVVPAAEIERVWTRGRASRLGLIVGAASGAALGALLASRQTNICPRSAQHPAGVCGGNAAVGALIGAGAGGVIGWTIGSGLPHWVRRYP